MIYSEFDRHSICISYINCYIEFRGVETEATKKKPIMNFIRGIRMLHQTFVISDAIDKHDPNLKIICVIHFNWLLFHNISRFQPLQNLIRRLSIPLRIIDRLFFGSSYSLYIPF